jgi:hypothetical protein
MKTRKKYQQQEETPQTVQEPMATYGTQVQEDVYATDVEEAYTEEEVQAMISALYVKMDEKFDRGETYEDLFQEYRKLVEKYGMQTASQREVYTMTPMEVEAILQSEEQLSRGEYYTQEEVDAKMEKLFEELDKECENLK